MELLSTTKGSFISHGSLHRAATLRHQGQRTGGALTASTHSLLERNSAVWTSPPKSNKPVVTPILFMLPTCNSLKAGSPQIHGKDNYVDLPTPKLAILFSFLNQMLISSRMPAVTFNILAVLSLLRFFLMSWFSYTKLWHLVFGKGRIRKSEPVILIYD